MSTTYSAFWNPDEHQALLRWWDLLPQNSGWRAELRRAETPADVLLCQGFRYLCYDMTGYWTKEQQLLGLAAVAGVLSHIKNNNGLAFAESCASPKQSKTDNKPSVSELRFSQLQKSHTLDEFYIRMIRLIHLLGNSVDPVSVANDTLQWFKESINGESDPDPRKRILVRWGMDYFQHLPK